MAGRLGIIPARGGSKGIPRKNIRELAGKPLIAYSIQAGLEAVETGVLDRLIVSTDDDEIAEISRSFGAEVPFMRPEELSGDKAKSVDLIIHAVDFFRDRGQEYDATLLLQPTCPLREGRDINEAFKIFDQTEADTLLSCFLEAYICDLVSYHRDGDMAEPLDSRHNQGIRRQDLPDLYVRNGAIYITSTDYLRRENKIFGGKMAMYVMEKERSVNIDTLYDFKLAEWMLGENDS